MRLVEDLGLQERVLFKPMLPIRQIAPVMANADLAVVPKRKDSFGNEAFSTKILEFMSSGVPVVVSDTKIDRYYFNDSVVRFFRDGDEDDLADSMLLLIHNQEFRRRLAANAASYVRNFDWAVKKKTYTGLVDALVYGRGHVNATAEGQSEFVPPNANEVIAGECTDSRKPVSLSGQHASAQKAAAS
jgi:glycosyltransferase involved in cell wall biosynthesis